jgi:aryl-alcohol dehydrogenase-like predicted oxidoreductase
MDLREQFVLWCYDTLSFLINFPLQNDSEELIGKWLRRTGKRSHIFLATKFGITPSHTVNGQPAYAKQSCADSLSKLGVAYVDLFYLHRIDTTVPIELTVRAMAELVK